MGRPKTPKYQLKDLIGIEREHHITQAIFFLANEAAEQNETLKLLLSKLR